MTHVASSTEGWYVVADEYTGKEADLVAGPFLTKREAEAKQALDANPEVPKVNGLYRVNPRYPWHYKLTVKVLDVLHAWTDPDGNTQVAVWVRRARPDNLNVTFGGDHGLVARADQFELLAEPVRPAKRTTERQPSWDDDYVRARTFRHPDGDVAGGSYSLAKLD